jgi:cholest-4-en-3-one 26-monooxygenase
VTSPDPGLPPGFDVRDVSLRTDVFSSARRGAIPRLEDTITPEEFEVTLSVLINKDAPEHTKLRGLVSRLFTPRAIQALRDTLEQRAERIVRAAVEGGQGEFVREVASELPMQAIAELIGVPESDRVKLFEWSNQMTGYDDDDVDVDSRIGAAQILGYSYELAEQRRNCPGNDVVSRLLTGTIDTEQLTPEQFGFFVVMLAVAGNETTRNATTMGMMAFLDHPDQWELFKAQRPSGRCLRESRELRHHSRPEPAPGLRRPGAHYCLGANLAKAELEIIFNKIADQMPDITRIGDAPRFSSGWINGIKRLDTHYGSPAGCPVPH